MTVDEIKAEYSMREIAERYGIEPRRDGMCSCPFHGADRHPSMKIYKDSFHCFTCGANGDIFTFIQNMDNCDFKTAFYSLGGTYEKPSKSSDLAIYHLKKAKEKREREKNELLQKWNLNNLLIGVYVKWLKRLEPLSDAWCDCMNAFTYQLGVDEELQKEMGGSEKN